MPVDQVRKKMINICIDEIVKGEANEFQRDKFDCKMLSDDFFYQNSFRQFYFLYSADQSESVNQMASVDSDAAPNSEEHCEEIGV